MQPVTLETPEGVANRGAAHGRGGAGVRSRGIAAPGPAAREGKA